MDGGVGYVELHCHSYYSFLDGASSPEALVTRAAELGYPALALTDHNNLSGAVRFWRAARERDIRPIIGAEVTLVDSNHSADQAGWPWDSGRPRPEPTLEQAKEELEFWAVVPD